MRFLLPLLAGALAASAGADSRTIRLPRDPALSPDGATLAFAWQGDVWLASSSGGDAHRLTTHLADDGQPCFSPDGAHVAFVSARAGGRQIFVVPAEGGAPEQVTHDSNSKTLLGFTADGAGLLVMQSTDRGFHYSESSRLFVVDLDGEAPKRMLFDAGVRSGALSPDGTHVLFTRGRSAWNRKGYIGPQAEQLWLADLSADPVSLSRVCVDREGFQNIGHLFPMWAPDGRSFYYTSDPDGTWDVYRRSFGSDGVGEPERVTDMRSIDRSDDGVAFPALAGNGRTMVLRRRFDLHRLDVASGELAPIELTATGDALASPIERTEENRARNVAFTSDGKQIAFVSGDDVWVMDRILREPRRVTSTPHPESSLEFSDDDTRLFFVSEAGGEADIWEATHAQEDGIWWLADGFTLRQVTDDPAVEGGLEPSPKGDHIAFEKGTDIWVMDADGSDHRRVIEAWSTPDFDWSPDGRWMVYATQDDNYNPDVFITRLDGTMEPFNLSRHPDRDGSPAWSGDGERIAFVGRRDGDEADIYWVDLTKKTAERTDRDAKLEKALEAMQKGKGGKSKGKGDEDSEKGQEKAEEEEVGDEVEIDFDGLLDRVRRISIRDSFEGSLLWSPDGKSLAFTATVDGERGYYKVEFPDPGRPVRVASSPLSGARWLEGGKEMVGLDSSGRPASMDAKGKTESFAFEVRRVRDWRDVRQVAFDQAWRAMRDRFYDGAMNNRDWNAIRAKYRPVAAECLGAAEFSQMMNMMLGELNASHMGHRGGSDPLPSADPASEWRPTTYHLGLRFAPHAGGDTVGLEVESVIPGGPTSLARSHVAEGETVLAIDGAELTAKVDVERLLTLDDARDVVLRVAGAEGAEREVTVTPTRSVRGLLYEEWVEANRQRVEELSEGKLGYLHIQGMNFPSFRQMEEDLYHAGYGKDGLIIDVRFNGGGSTTDHVMTALTQPVHAITQSRGSGEGYPQDRKVYASWHKPIVLMCNEHSFSNAEILSHAVKQNARGRLVGMRTAGGVISTGGQGLLDGSFIRMPTRGWYLVSTGEDMELNGCLPDIAMWNDPDGEDAQLAKAVEALAEDVAAVPPTPKLVPAAEKRR